MRRCGLRSDDQQETAAPQPDRNRQRHAHADRPEERRVGFAEEFADEAEGAIAQEEDRR